MSYHTPAQDQLPTQMSGKSLIEIVMQALASDEPDAPKAKRRRGRPQVLSQHLLGMGILWCLLHGWVSQWDLWRRISVFGVTGLPTVKVSDQAVYKRLANGSAQLMQQWCAQVTSWLYQHMHQYHDRSLLPHFDDIMVMDESVMDAMHRWVQQLREVPAGSSQLLAGRLSCLFDVRRQLFKRVDWLEDAAANCRVNAIALLDEMKPGTLLLFDLGYYGFEWFDTLTQRRIAWVTRLRANGSYTTQHVLIERSNYKESLIFLGAYRADHAAYLLRLVQVRHQGQWHEYISNVTNPMVLSGADIVRLYARRWDIELAFRTLKEHLGLRLLWSAKWEVIEVQLWASVLLAQVLHCLQLKTAAHVHVNQFDVSLELLARYLPDLSEKAFRERTSVIELIEREGRHLVLVRPSTRKKMEVPEFPIWEFAPVPADLVFVRQPRYAHKQPSPKKEKTKAKTDQKGAPKGEPPN